MVCELILMPKLATNTEFKTPVYVVLLLIIPFV